MLQDIRARSREYNLFCYFGSCVTWKQQLILEIGKQKKKKLLFSGLFLH